MRAATDLALISDPGLGSLVFIGMSIEILGAGALNGLAPEPDPFAAFLRIVNGPQKASLAEIRLHFEDPASPFTSNFVGILVPEPGTGTLLALGLGGLGWARRRSAS